MSHPKHTDLPEPMKALEDDFEEDPLIAPLAEAEDDGNDPGAPPEPPH